MERATRKGGKTMVLPPIFWVFVCWIAETCRKPVARPREGAEYASFQRGRCKGAPGENTLPGRARTVCAAFSQEKSPAYGTTTEFVIYYFIYTDPHTDPTGGPP
jgi:hypothetical protein